jgi:4-amino-4-deoxy-L-arabinose transferase-like glycosyltransferase
MLLRVPSLDRVSLNPDESQYEATASYLVATGKSALAPTLGAPGTFLLFTVAHRLFGPYPIFEVRLLVQVLCLGLAWVLFWIVRREANRWCGLAAGLVFLHYGMRFEGLTVNREWFAVLMATTGIVLWLAVADRSGPRGDGVRFLGGAVTGLALWFKLQASFTVFVVPLAIAWRALERRQPGRGLRRLLVFGAGGAASGIAYLASFYRAGNLGTFLGDVLRDWNVFVRGNERIVSAAAESDLRLYLDAFLVGLPHRPLLLAAYGFAAVVAVQASVRVLRPAAPASLAARPATVACAAWLVLAMACVQLGHRFFAHYYLLMVPAVSALCGFALWWLWHEAPEARWSRWGTLLFVGLATADAILQARAASARRVRLDDVQTIVALACAAAAAGLLAYLILRPLARAPRVAAAWIGLEALLLIGLQQTTPTPRSMSHNPYSFDSLAAYLRQASRPGDRLFVWGWAPEIYSLTRLEAASEVVTSEFVVRDFLAAPDRPSLDPAWVDRMMRDLRWREPRFIVDASARSWTSTDARFYRLGLYPGFELVDLLGERYVARARIDGCTVYERRDPDGSTDPRGAPGMDSPTPQSALEPGSRAGHTRGEGRLLGRGVCHGKEDR